MNGSKLIAFGLQGKQIWTGSAQSSGSWGNVDTDKLAEFIDPYGANGMTGTDMHGQVTQLKGWNVSVGSARYSFDEVDCTDLDGDGEDEVIAPRSGYLNPKSGKYVSFTRPITAGSLYTPSFSEASAAVAGDFDGDGKRELAVIDTGGNSPTYESLGTALVIYGADGTAQYYEEFGKSVAGLAAVHDGKRERLAIMLSDRLLVSP